MNLDVNEKVRLIIIGLLTTICTILTVHSHIIIKTDTIFVHLYYIPMIIAIFWWEKKSLLLILFFVLVTIITQYPEFTFIYGDIIKLTILLIVSLLTLYLIKQTKNEIENTNITDENPYYQTLLNSSLDYIVFLDEKYKIKENNVNFEYLTGKTKKELTGQNIFNLKSFNLENKDSFCNKINQIPKTRTIEPYETQIKDFNNKPHWVICYGTAIFKYGEFKGIMIILNDITQMKDVENQLRVTVNEKEMMIKEVHHRVKNNLMSISSLLNIQSDYVEDEEVLEILKESENRANTMALIHKKLYQSDKSHLELGDYLLSLSKELLETYSSTNNIKLKINVDEIYLDVDTAIPLGLIVNEVITNSIKYGFPNGKSGTITISLDDLGETAVLSIEDDGIGLPKELDIEKTNTLGMQLIISLTKQINAKLTLLSEKGTKYKIEFKK